MKLAGGYLWTFWINKLVCTLYSCILNHFLLPRSHKRCNFCKCSCYKHYYDIFISDGKKCSKSQIRTALICKIWKRMETFFGVWLKGLNSVQTSNQLNTTENLIPFHSVYFHQSAKESKVPFSNHNPHIHIYTQPFFVWTTFFYRKDQYPTISQIWSVIV